MYYSARLLGAFTEPISSLRSQVYKGLQYQLNASPKGRLGMIPYVTCLAQVYLG